jgi:transposase, IS30 family
MSSGHRKKRRIFFLSANFKGASREEGPWRVILNTLNPLTPYSQLTLQQRIKFQILKEKNLRVVDIAKELGVHHATLYREKIRNRTTGAAGDYDSCAADALAKTRKQIPRSPTKCTPENQRLVEAKLLEDWSPDAIAGQAKLSGNGPQICTNTIYKIVEQDRNAGGELYKLLPNKDKGYQKNRTGAQRKGKLPARPGQELADRPIGIAERLEPGHVEIDLMFSGETVWLTWLDRYTRKINISAFPSKESEPIAAEILLLFSQEKIRTITTDRGLEWSALITLMLELINNGKEKLSVYFCNAYCSWEKGAIENANRLLRRYFPKGKNLPWSDKQWLEASRVADLMNNKPRKILGYKTPNEVEKEWPLKLRKEAWKKTMASSPDQAA